MEARTCSTCNKEKELSSFRRRKRNVYRNECKPCYRIKADKWEYERRKEVFRLLGNECVSCGEEDFIVLCVDHIDGSGAEDRRIRHGRAYYTDVIKGEIENYQLLCRNCNWRKRVTSE